MDFVVTGCAGFIGSEVARALAHQGHHVLGLDDLNDAYDPRLKEWRLARLAPLPGIEVRRVDVRDRRAVQRALAERKPHAVLHLAARAGVRQSLVDPWTYVDANCTGTLNVLDACRELDISRLQLASTSSLYGANNTTPFHEDANTDRPLSPYAASKKAAEAMCAAYSHLYGMDIAITRFFTVYGPAGRPDMSIFRFIRWIAEGEPLHLLGDGSQERDFTYVTDVARGAILATERVRGCEVYNLGSDRPVPLRHVIELIEQELGRKARIERHPQSAADVRATWADISKARKHLEWSPRVELRDGIRNCVAWYLENRAFASTLDLGGIA